MKVRQARYRALIRLDRLDRDAARGYMNRMRGLMVEAHCPGPPGSVRYFPAEIYRDGGQPLRSGDRAVVTITMTGDDAAAFFGAGQQFRLWRGRVVGHGTISRKVYSEYTPS
jgi:hypothetical protein